MTTGVYGLLVNGAGKTTCVCFCTLLRPTEGKIIRKDILAMDGDYRKILGYLPQDFGFPEFTVKDYLLYISSIKGIKPDRRKKKRVRELVARLVCKKHSTKK